MIWILILVSFVVGEYNDLRTIRACQKSEFVPKKRVQCANPKDILNIPHQTCNVASECPHYPSNPFTICSNGYCCESNIVAIERLENEMVYCDHNMLPLKTEMRCFESELGQANGCPRGGYCNNGHCCPGVIIHPNKDFDLPSILYYSNEPCAPSDFLHKKYHFGFCSSRRKIAFLGKMNACDTQQSIDYLRNCSSSFDCGAGQICIYGINDGFCANDPEACKVKSDIRMMTDTACVFAIIFGLLYAFFYLIYNYPDTAEFWIPFVKRINKNATRFDMKRNGDDTLLEWFARINGYQYEWDDNDKAEILQKNEKKDE